MGFAPMSCHTMKSYTTRLVDEYFQNLQLTSTLANFYPKVSVASARKHKQSFTDIRRQVLTYRYCHTDGLALSSVSKFIIVLIYLFLYKNKFVFNEPTLDVRIKSEHNSRNYFTPIQKHYTI